MNYRYVFCKDSPPGASADAGPSRSLTISPITNDATEHASSSRYRAAASEFSSRSASRTWKGRDAAARDALRSAPAPGFADTIMHARAPRRAAPRGAAWRRPGIVSADDKGSREEAHMQQSSDLALDDVFVEDALREAVKAGGVKPVFQPIVHLGTGEVSSLEVLSRWQHHELGSVSPTVFIRVAESAGFIAELTAQVIRYACTAALAWGGEFRLAINISPLHFQQGDMPALFEDSVNATGFPLARTQIEITESAVIDDTTGARATIDQLRSKGVRIVLDDFGTGYSSLTRLQSLPFDKIKIDASFVQAVCMGGESRKIVSAVIGLGHSMGMPVVAEGVETREQADMLLRLGCDMGQGWLFGRPVGSERVPDMLRARGQKAYDKVPVNLPGALRLAQIDAAYAAAPVGLCLVDANLRIVFANERFRRFTWTTSGTVPIVVGRALGELVPVLAHVSPRDFGALAREKGVLTFRAALAGPQAAVQISASPASDAASDFAGYSVSVVDCRAAGFDDTPWPR
jgi:EAL domain-containing protein (putative c-di-GMP-specific phosphodiesterase class I)